MGFPNSFDGDDLLLGDLQDQKSLILSLPCTDVDTQLYFESVVGVAVPTYLRIGNELVYVTASDGIDMLTVTRGPNAGNYLVGDVAFLVVAGEHLTILRDRAILVQKYQGLVGDDAEKPANPEVSMVYVATDTNKVYVCTTAGTWSLLGGATTHEDVLREGDTDDHAQYFTLARLIAWHDNLAGDHVTDGDNHDHRYGGAGRVATATSGALPSKSVGHVRLATDTGELFMALSSSSWVAVTGAPAGTIGFLLEADATSYGNACPTGWSRYTALDGKFPKGLPSGVSSPFGSGGALTHTHTYTQVPAHTHQIPAMSPSSSSGGNHSHSFPFSTLSSGSGLASTGSSASGGSFGTSSGGSHTHTFTYPATNTAASTGSASATSASGSSQPQFLEVVFCKKD